MCGRVSERVGSVEGAAQEERPAVQHSVGEVEMGDCGTHDTREMEGWIGSSCGGRRVFVSKDGSKASQSSIKRIRVGGKGKVGGAIPGEVDVALGVGERHYRERRGDGSKRKEDLSR